MFGISAHNLLYYLGLLNLLSLRVLNYRMRLTIVPTCIELSSRTVLVSGEKSIMVIVL